MKLFGIVYILTAPTLMGIFVTVLLALDQRTFAGGSIGLAAVAGAIAALPVAWILAKRLAQLASGRRA